MTARLFACGALVLLVLASGGAAAGGGGLVALNTCDASCPDESTDIYVGCGNGTVTDNRSGLVWLANANCFGSLDWNEAMTVVAGLGDLPNSACGGMDADECDCGLSDHSSPGEWRLPSMAEWKTMSAIIADVDVCEPAILDDIGMHCWDDGCFESSGCSFYGVQSSLYWSSSSYVSESTFAWVINLAHGGVSIVGKGDDIYAWPVRGGQ